jgi:hypothetical protein
MLAISVDSFSRLLIILILESVASQRIPNQYFVSLALFRAIW